MVSNFSFAMPNTVLWNPQEKRRGGIYRMGGDGREHNETPSFGTCFIIVLYLSTVKLLCQKFCNFLNVICVQIWEKGCRNSFPILRNFANISVCLCLWSHLQQQMAVPWSVQFPVPQLCGHFRIFYRYFKKESSHFSYKETTMIMTFSMEMAMWQKHLSQINKQHLVFIWVRPINVVYHIPSGTSPTHRSCHLSISVKRLLSLCWSERNGIYKQVPLFCIFTR